MDREAGISAFCGLRCGPIVLHLITVEERAAIRVRFHGFPDAREMLEEMDRNYLPDVDEAGRRTKWGFYSTLHGELAGMSLLGVSSWDRRVGYTGADTLLHQRGRGVAPGSKPHLFYLGFHLLGLERIETGCSVSNFSSRRSIENTPGFEYEGLIQGAGKMVRTSSASPHSHPHRNSKRLTPGSYNARCPVPEVTVLSMTMH